MPHRGSVFLGNDEIRPWRVFESLEFGHLFELGLFSLQLVLLLLPFSLFLRCAINIPWQHLAVSCRWFLQTSSCLRFTSSSARFAAARFSSASRSFLRRSWKIHHEVNNGSCTFSSQSRLNKYHERAYMYMYTRVPCTFTYFKASFNSENFLKSNIVTCKDTCMKKEHEHGIQWVNYK